MDRIWKKLIEDKPSPMPGGGGGGGGNSSSFFYIEYSGLGISLNKFYSQRHWSYRKKQKDSYKAIYTSLIKDIDTPKGIDDYTVTMAYNSRLDIDNTIIMVKVFVDTLRDLDIVVNDSPKYWKILKIFYDENLPKNFYGIKVDWKS